MKKERVPVWLCETKMCFTHSRPQVIDMWLLRRPGLPSFLFNLHNLREACNFLAKAPSIIDGDVEFALHLPLESFGPVCFIIR